jgi:2-oxoisovalerate dehydrogenase E1 component
MVLRIPIGGYVQGGSIWHSQCGESIFAHIPGLIVMYPSRARDVVGLLRTAFECEDPVLFLEHKRLYRQPFTRDPFPPRDFRIPLGKADYVQRGDDLTIVTYGYTTHLAREAAAALAKDHDVSVEIVDLRCLVPWDTETVAESVAKTSRVLVLHEDIKSVGFGGEVASWIAEHCFSDLDAPVGRIGAQSCHVAYEPSLAEAILPQVSDITSGALEVLAY